ncbi:MAG TPA: D-alanyl-lipoteichoic acid biosynthesis protein DltD [Chthoniobacterales bacterium]|nr:D-alanyl-lipoteichoic acid biosynthesis protein DltD [Chthoniobacterales bacterium]
MQPMRANGLPHLGAMLLACGVALLVLLAGRVLAVYREAENIAAVAPELFPIKNQGLAFQRLAARTNGVLPLYGSSELLGPAGARASDFFSTTPTGFQVSPVGKAGATALITLEKLGALAGEFRGRKVVISISSAYFASGITSYWYEGNFSPFAVSELTFGNEFDRALKRDIAVRLLHFPHTLEKIPVTEFALQRLAAGTLLDDLGFYLVWPLGMLENLILDLQDHFAALSYLRREHKRAPARLPQAIDWSTLIANADNAVARSEEPNASTVGSQKQPLPGSADAWFKTRMNRASEWKDFELLLRSLAQIHAKPLLINMPLDGCFYDRGGVSAAARREYYDRVEALAARYHFALVNFQEHDEDARFLAAQPPDLRQVPSAHLSAKGWMYYNRVLDAFYHDRLPQS